MYYLDLLEKARRTATYWSFFLEGVQPVSAVQGHSCSV